MSIFFYGVDVFMELYLYSYKEEGYHQRINTVVIHMMVGEAHPHFVVWDSKRLPKYKDGETLTVLPSSRYSNSQEEKEDSKYNHTVKILLFPRQPKKKKKFLYPLPPFFWQAYPRKYQYPHTCHVDEREGYFPSTAPTRI